MTWWIAGAVVVVYVLFRARAVEPYNVDVVEQDVYVEGLPEALDGLRIAHVTDVHMKELGDVERFVLERLKRKDYDVLCLTGDYLADPGAIQFFVPFVMEAARGRPAFAVLGNNDYEHGVDTELVKETLRRSGTTLLMNEGMRAVWRGVPVYVAGVDDPHTDRSDVETALAGLDGQRFQGDDRPFTVLLAHSPDVLLDEASQKADVVLAGHTHGGQVRLPWIGPLQTNSRIGRAAAAGVVRRGGVVAYVSRGLGMSKLPIRLFCRPELTFLTFKAVPASETAASSASVSS